MGIAKEGRRLTVEPRSISTAFVKPRAVVKYGEIQPFLEPLGLKPKKELKLARRLRDVLSDYLGRKLEAEHYASYAASIAELRQIAANARQLLASLNAIRPEFLLALDEARNPARVSEPRPIFYFLNLTELLQELANAADVVAADTKPNAAHRPKNDLLRDAVKKAVTSIQRATSEKIRTSRSKGSVVTRRFVGVEGTVLRDLFKQVANVREASLFALVRELQGRSA
jgi:hypothetical protein